MHINDFPSCSQFFNFTLFADDSTLTCSFDNHDGEFIARTVETELTPITTWLDANKLSINHKKTNFIVFSYRKKFLIRPLFFGSDQIKQTNSTKFVGLQIDENFKFDKQVNAIATKISKTTGILYRMNKFLPQNILKLLYDSLIVPYLSYGVEIWHSAPLNLIERLFILQKKAVRAMNNLPYNAHTNNYFRDMQLLKLDDLYNLLLMTDVYSRSTEVINAVGIRSDVHSYETRNRNQINLPRYQRTATQRSFIYQQLIKWQHIPQPIKDSHSKNIFKRRYKSYLLASY